MVKVLISRDDKAKNFDLPEYATQGSSGVDLRASEDYIIKSGERALVATGIRLAIPAGYEVQVRPRSGLALKHGIIIPNSPGTIDSDYRGEVKVILMNLGREDFIIKAGDRIAQMVLAPVAKISWEERAELEETARGAGGFGSTGAK
ncbi:MAG: dUTP diphosphatase [Synergistaceae bacterium]|nr:dUTP diphosphatase [Synergistaceae bacterium]MBQ3625648.1 dUTP diphosphatase [Synergistaceae bacterium]MBQ9895824.1 dUTP diphosphatase [Synergistaceae bacterium]